jgi:spore germination protein KA
MTKLKEFSTLTLGEKISFFRDSFEASEELIIRSLILKNKVKSKVALIYISNIVKTADIQQFILRPLLESNYIEKDLSTIEDYIFNTIQITKLTKETDSQKLIDSLLSGNTLILIENVSSIFIADTPDWQKRSVPTLISERGLGSQIAFSEDLQMNLNIIRKLIKNKNLMIESYSIGEKTNTNYSIVYSEDLVDRIVLDELNKKLKKIKLDFVFDLNYLIENLQEKKISPFPLLMTSERPDTACSSILQGRIIILLEGTTKVIILPITLSMLLQAADDYYIRWELGLNRIFRFVCFIVTVYTPALYTCLLNFHEEMLPSSTYFNLIGQSQGTPFPLVIEVFLLNIMLQIIMDAIFRMNKDLILVISILGTFMIGETAVNAGIIRPASIIIVSLTFIASFVLPRQDDLSSVVRLLRLVFLLSGNLLGFYGVMLVTFFWILHMSSLRSFGIPYLSPFAPFNFKEQQDTLIRSDLNSITNSPHNIKHEELIQEKKNQKK